MVRLLIEDVTLTRSEKIRVDVRFKGGAAATPEPAVPRPSCKMWQTGKQVIARVDKLLDDCTYEQIASILNEERLYSGKGNRSVEYLSATSAGNTPQKPLAPAS